MNTNQTHTPSFEDDLRTQFTSVPIPLTVNPATILATAHTAKRRNHLWTGIGIALLAIVLALVIALAIHLLTTPPTPDTTPAPNPLATPTATTTTPVTPTPSVSPTPSPATPTPEPSATYLLTGDQITCGTPLCADGVVVSVKVTVQGPDITALVCIAQEIDVNDPQAVQECRGMSGAVDWDPWSGTRSGTTAIVTPTTWSDPFYWATIEFASSAPDAAVVGFVAPDDCERQDGTHGTVDLNTCR